MRHLYPPITDERRPSLIEDLKSAKPEAMKEAVEGYLGLAYAIAARWKTRFDFPDLVSVAFMALVEAVHAVTQGKMEHDNLTAFIAQAIRWKIKNYMRDEFYATRQIHQMPRTNGHGTKTAELMDEILHACDTETEVAIVTLRAQGLVDSEIATALCISQTAVCKLRRNTAERFDILHKFDS